MGHRPATFRQRNNLNAGREESIHDVDTEEGLELHAEKDVNLNYNHPISRDALHLSKFHLTLHIIGIEHCRKVEHL